MLLSCALAVVSLLSTALADDNPYVQQRNIGSSTNKVSERLDDNEFPRLEAKDWRGHTIVFLPKRRAVQQFGYRSFRREGGTPESPSYYECVGRVGQVIEVREQAREFEVVIEMTDNKQRFLGSTMFGTLSGVMFTKDLDSVRVNWIGDTVWLLGNQLNQYNDSTDTMHSRHVKKFSAATITNAIAGTEDENPVRLIFKTHDGDEGFVDLNVSNTNVMEALWESGRLKDYFLKESPRKVYPWRSEIWDAIENESILVGMSSVQVRFSWGEPIEINRTLHSNLVSEQWVYPNNHYVYFENGVVTVIQD